MKNPNDPIEPATFRLVAQCINCATVCPTEGNSKMQTQKSALYLLEGLPWENGWNLIEFGLHSLYTRVESKPMRHEICVGERVEGG